VDLVLDKKVNEGNQSGEESASKYLSILDGFGIGRAEGNATQCPRESCHEVRDHEDVVPVMIVGRCNVCPSSTGEGAKYSYAEDEAREGGLGIGPRSEKVP
jgi:hypothetical protein